MPKLSKNSLEKRFTCQYCGKSIRSRQGLSGHIQFKHAGGQKSPYTDLNSVVSLAKRLKSLWEKGGLSQSRSETRARIVARWAVVMTTCDVLNIRTNDQDFKNYLIASLARMHENEELRDQLIND